MEVEGTVTKVEWKSPHAWIYVDVTDDKGEKVNWSFELPSPITLMRRGWTRDSLKPGDRVKVAGAPAELSGHRHRQLHQGWQRQALFTGTTQIYEPAGELKDPSK